MGIPHQHPDISVSAELLKFWQTEMASFRDYRNCFMTQVVNVKVHDAAFVTSPSPRTCQVVDRHGEHKFRGLGELSQDAHQVFSQ